MKKLYILLIVIGFASCDKPADCIKSAGSTATINYTDLRFSKILVRKGIALVVIQGEAYDVKVQSGENLISDIEVKVVNDMLTLEDNTTCNWVRDYGQTTVYVTAPNLTEIYSKTELDINSQGTLTYPDLQAFAMDSYDGFTGTGTGDFHLNIDNNKLSVNCNSVAQFFLTGHTQHAQYNLFEYGGKILGQDLVAETLQFYHRGTNDMYVHASQSLSGDLFNIGNVYSVTRPPQVAVTQHYQGQLIFN